ncbi:MAG: hypothetical protein AB7O62_18010 [Pirellulales bacterium]
METSLHRSLKHLYAAGPLALGQTEADDSPPLAQVEVRLDGFRIDAVVAGCLIEIQHGSLAAIRAKITRLLQKHDVLVVKPIIASKLLVKRAKANGPEVDRRQSPKRGKLLDLFDELIYFTKVFPHPRLTIEAVLVDVEEWRRPGHGRRRRWRKDDHTVEDQHLLAIRQTQRFRTAADLLAFLPESLPRPFHSGHLAAALAVPRWCAQRMVYVMRHTGTLIEAGKQGNARLYETPAPRRKRRRSA